MQVKPLDCYGPRTVRPEGRCGCGVASLGIAPRLRWPSAPSSPVATLNSNCSSLNPSTNATSNNRSLQRRSATIISSLPAACVPGLRTRPGLSRRVPPSPHEPQSLSPPALRAVLHARRRPRRGRSGLPPPCRANVLEGFSGVSNLMAPEFATVFSAIIAITSVSINLYGGLLTEKRRAELAREVERERQVMAAQEEERSVVARYRGPLLEATVDLEARLYHIATLTGEWRSGDVVCEEEVVYTLFTLAQWLGFLEVIRREGPRERSFLNRGGTTGAGSGGEEGGGTDTLTTLVESFRFVLSAHPATLVKWYEQGDEREHPGCRSRALMLRGTPALPDDDWPPRRHPPPPQQQLAVAVAAAAVWSGPDGRRDQQAQQPQLPAAPTGAAAPAPWYGIDHYHNASYGNTPPPPTKPVVLYDSLQAAGPGLGAGAGAELVIGSLDENDLAAAGLGLQHLLPDNLPGQPDPGPGLTAEAAASGAAPPLPYTGATAGAAAVGGSAAAVAAAMAAAAMMAEQYGSSLASWSSLSSIDEGGFGAGSPGGGGGGGGRRSAPRDVFNVSRGSQRSIGSMMVVTPMGASRHYTLSYGDFYNRYYLDDFFASWLRPVHTDILALVGGRRWRGQGPFPLNRWTRLLLLQQLLVETIDLLDPAHVRVPGNRRVVLAPVPYQQAPELEAYRARMREMSQLDSPLLLQQQMLQEGASGTMGRIRAALRTAGAALVAQTAAITAGAGQGAPATAVPAQPAAPTAAGGSAAAAPTPASQSQPYTIPYYGNGNGSGNGNGVNYQQQWQQQQQLYQPSPSQPSLPSPPPPPPPQQQQEQPATGVRPRGA